MQYGNAAMVSSIVTAKEVVELKSKVQDLEAENARLKLRLAKIEEKLGL
jgi:regulator of replication initiation timing